MPIPWTGIQSPILDQHLTNQGIPRLALIQSDRNQNDDPYFINMWSNRVRPSSDQRFRLNFWSNIYQDLMGSIYFWINGYRPFSLLRAGQWRGAFLRGDGALRLWQSFRPSDVPTSLPCWTMAHDSETLPDSIEATHLQLERHPSLHMSCSRYMAAPFLRRAIPYTQRSIIAPAL